MTDMRETALRLASQGYKVFPLTPGAKSPPLVKSWQTAATTDPATVGSWWEQWPQANVGIHCDGLVVIDVDPKNGGRESLAALEKEIQLDATLEVDTPSGGTHLYYRAPPGTVVRNGVNVLGPGLDIRSTGGYVVAPGSATAAGEYVVAVDEPVVEVNQPLAARLKVAAQKPDRPTAPVEAIATDPDLAEQRAVGYLLSLPVAQEGERNVSLMLATRKIGDFGVTVDQAIRLMNDHFRANPPVDQEEIERTVRSSYRNRQSAVGADSAEGMGFEMLPDENEMPSKPQDGGKPDALDLLHPSDVQTSDVLKTKYLVKHVLDQQSNAMLFGTWNVGKTFVVLDMAAAIACGLPWFGNRVTQGRVLYLGYEGALAMRKRMLALRTKYPMLKDPATPFRWAALTVPLTEEAGGVQLARLMARFKTLHGGPPDLLVIDPLMDALGGDDSDAEKITALNKLVAKVRAVEKCTVLRVHHTGHGSEERARGHSSLPASVDTNIRVCRDHVTLVKQRDDGLPKFDFILNQVEIGVDQDGEKVTTMLVEHLEDNPMSGKLTKSLKELKDALIRRFGDGKVVKATDVSDCCPEHMAADQKRKLREDLVRRQYLIADEKGYKIHAAGPTPQFDEEPKE